MQLYKYLSALSLFDLILNKRLYFHPLHLFEDQWEAVPLPRETEFLKAYGKRTEKEDDPASDVYANMLHLARFTACASCWHLGNSESMAMWKIYAGTEQGCCIVADQTKVIELLKTETSHFPVKYINRNDHFELESPLPPYYHSAQYKDLAYEFEQEFRFILYSTPTIKRTTLSDGSIWTEPDIERSTLTLGKYVPFNLEHADARVLISPFLKAHERQVISELVARICGARVPVEPSRLVIG